MKMSEKAENEDKNKNKTARIATGKVVVDAGAKVRGLFTCSHVICHIEHLLCCCRDLLLLSTVPAVCRLTVSIPAYMFNATQIHTCKYVRY